MKVEIVKSFTALVLVFTLCLPGVGWARPSTNSQSIPATNLAPAKTNENRQPQPDDEKILNVVANAREQADNWVDVLAVGGLREEASNDKVDVLKAERLLDQIELDRKNEQHWEQTVWTIPNSEMFPGESIESHWGYYVMVDGTGHTIRQRFPGCEKTKQCAPGLRETVEVVYIVNAPLEVKAHILMEGLRHGISHWAAIQDFEGKTPNDAFETAWNQAWFDARNVYCRRSPGAKYFDLSNDEQICK